MTGDDYRERSTIRLKEERMAHIVRHPEIRPLLDRAHPEQSYNPSASVPPVPHLGGLRSPAFPDKKGFPSI